jgi:hypothetical protein
MTERLPLKRLVAEAVVVVGSILLAFAIDAAWDARQENREALELLRGLEEELEANDQVLAASLEASRAGRERLATFLALSPIEASQVSQQDAMATVYRPHIRDWSETLSTGFLDATISSGKLSLIRSPEVRASLARFRGEQGNVRDVLAHLDAYNQKLADLLATHPEVRTRLAAEEGHLSSSTLQAMRENQELAAVASAKLMFWGGYLIELGNLQESLRATLRIVRDNGPNHR